MLSDFSVKQRNADFMVEYLIWFSNNQYFNASDFNINGARCIYRFV